MILYHIKKLIHYYTVASFLFGNFQKNAYKLAEKIILQVANSMILRICENIKPEKREFPRSNAHLVLKHALRCRKKVFDLSPED